jgi:hypothetical protein
LYSISPSTLWITCLVVSLVAAALMMAAWLRERGTKRSIDTSGAAFFADERVGPRD